MLYFEDYDINQDLPATWVHFVKCYSKRKYLTEDLGLDESRTGLELFRLLL